MFRRRRSREDFSEELQAHLALETDRLVAEGWSHEEARTAARRAFGNVTRVSERFHETSRWIWGEQLLQDVRYAARVLRQSPAFLVTAVLTLAVGIAAVTVAFTVFNAYFLKPYAVRSPETLHRIRWASQSSGGETFQWREYDAIRARRDLFEGVVAQDIQLVSSSGRPLVAALVSPNYFEALAPRMRLGRGLAAFDAEARARAAVLSDNAWHRLFARDPAVVGRDLEVSRQIFTIVGVMRPEFSGLGDTPADVWLPLESYAAVLRPELTGPEQPRAVDLLGWLREGVGVEQAQAALSPLLAVTMPRQENVRAVLQPEPTTLPMDVELLLVIAPVFAAFGLVLVTACANVSNVMLARAIARHREIAVRLSLGASRGRVIRQLLTEGLLIAAFAGSVGLALATWALQAASLLFFTTLPPSFGAVIRLAPMGIDARVFGFALLLAAAATLLFALLPAVQASRLPLTEALRGHATGTLRNSRLRSVLVVGQVTVSIVLVVAAVTFARGGAALESMDLGYETERIVSVTPRAQAHSMVPALEAVLAADPRITDVAVTSRNPGKGAFPASRRVAAVPSDGAAATVTRFTFVSPGYFRLLGMPIERGRPFMPEEARGSAPVVIISSASAQAFWPGQDPIGRTIRIEPSNGRPVGDLPGYPVVTVVGTTNPVMSESLANGLDAGHIYLPMTAAHPRAAALLLRGRTDADVAPAVLQDLLSRVATDPQAFETLPLEEIRAMQLYPLQIASFVGTLLGGVALVLSVMGLYGVLTYSVNQRTREIGIRMALGATAGAVVRLVTRQSLRLAGIGALIGLILAFAAMRGLNAAIQFATVSLVDPAAFAAAIALVLGATAMAAFQPARRATRVHPATTLRADA